VSTWRDRARPLIAKVLRETEGQDEKVIKKALRDAYPWGQRAMHPYQIWLDEIRRQRGLKTTGPSKGKPKDVPPDSRQEELFDE
jgi:hypothetical protein